MGGSDYTEISRDSYPQSRLILLDARVVYLTWASMALCGVASLVGIFVPSLFDGPIRFLIACFLALGGLHVALALMHRCPVCRKHPTVQGFAPVHPASEAANGKEGWTGVVVSVIRRRSFACIHCGTHFHVQ